MKRLLMIAVGCVLLASSSASWAQSGPDDSGLNARERYARRGWDDGDRDRDDERPYHGQGPHHGWDGPGGSRGGAQFWLRSGDVRLGVRCDPNEPMRACVDAAMTLLDKARSLPSAGATSAPPPSPPAAR